MRKSLPEDIVAEIRRQSERNPLVNISDERGQMFMRQLEVLGVPKNSDFFEFVTKHSFAALDVMHDWISIDFNEPRGYLNTVNIDRDMYGLPEHLVPIGPGDLNPIVWSKLDGRVYWPQDSDEIKPMCNGEMPPRSWDSFSDFLRVALFGDGQSS